MTTPEQSQDHKGDSPEQEWPLWEVFVRSKAQRIQLFFRTGGNAGIQASHAGRLRRQLAQLNHAAASRDMNLPGWHLHPLKGEMSGFWSVWVNGNWRLVFRFEDGDAVFVDYTDHH